MVPDDLRSGHVDCRAHFGDGRGDLLVGRRHDLSPVGCIDLVPVVVRRVVTCGDDDGGHRPELLCRVSHQRGRRGVGEISDVKTCGNEHRDHFIHEDRRRQACVSADHHKTPVFRCRSEHVIGESSRRSDDGGTVHPVGAGLDPPAQASGTEQQRCSHPLLELGLIARVEDLP